MECGWSHRHNQLYGTVGKKPKNKPAMTLQKNTYKNGEIGERFKHDCFTYPLVNERLAIENNHW